MNIQPSIAYFSMEIGLSSQIPTYSGGLGVLAGDTLRSAADMGLPMVGVTLLHRRGYFSQRLDPDGTQHEEPACWAPSEHLHELAERARVTIEGRRVKVRIWRYVITGNRGHEVPVYLLDTDVEGNADEDRRITDALYGGDEADRLRQEIVLGIGGVRSLHALGCRTIDRYHMNEGHSALLTFELLRRSACERGGEHIDEADLEHVRERCVFTTHTPVPAGHDQFSTDLAHRLIGPHPAFDHTDLVLYEDRLNMTCLALNLSGYVNGVARKHGEVSRRMFAGYEIEAITNGVHAPMWTSEPFQRLFDRHVPGWRDDNFSLRYAGGVPTDELWEAHTEAKRRLIEHVREATGTALAEDVCTIGFARRATPYKRSDLLFHDIERLGAIAQRVGSVQLVWAGKAHPRDEGGKALIRRVHEAFRQLGAEVRGVYLPDYDMHLGGLITAGVDVWLNTPLPPMEASGTSGMKAALNGVPSLSVLDGWWIEGCIDGVTGWSIGRATERGQASESEDSDRHAAELYDRLENDVLPCYYKDRERFRQIMRSAIAINGAFFNTHRMVMEYAAKAYSIL